MAIAPLFLKYKTRSGNCYVYDPGTNEIVRVGEVIFEVLNDFHLLDNEEIIVKYRLLGEANVREALARLEELQSRRILCDHGSQTSSKTEQVVCDGKVEPITDFLGSRRRMLIIELTQRCNLRCEYCCYGEHYSHPQLRRHGCDTISFDTAKKAVEEFIFHEPQNGLVAFYGGEPLLEFELLKEIVFFAEGLAGKHSLDLGFSTTTNGTLLTDEKIHFFVEHDFMVFVSLDGTKASHDRYRVFRSKQHQKRAAGSYDIIVRNLKRFVELYPDHSGRGLSVTLTATTDYSGSNDLFGADGPLFFPLHAQSLRPITNDLRKEENWRDIFLESRGVTPCEGGSCDRQRPFPMNDNENAGTTDDLMVHLAQSEDVKKIPEFVN